jgi:hypothetical protein
MRFIATLAFLSVAIASHAGDVATIRGQSDRFAVTFPHPLELRASEIEVREWDAQELDYRKAKPSVPFWRECKMTNTTLQCSPKGISPLAGAKYKMTFDGTPTCPGQGEPRFTCVSGCKSSVPRYLSINPWEC